jgi:peptide/nickel transport system ATP-binding protein
MTALLDVEHACKTFRSGSGARRRRVVALDDVSLTVGEGEIVALVGESGSGKSTLGRAVVGLERLDGGKAMFDGVEYARMSERALRRLRPQMHLVLQDPYQSLHPGMRVATAVAEPLEIAGTGNAKSPRVVEALEEVGLTPASTFMDRYPHQLSGGQRQRVVLARALVGRPRLVVADEPTSMVDATLRAGIVALIRRLRDRFGIAFLVITHDLDMAAAVAEQVAVMQRGRLVECGPTPEVFAAPSDDYTRTLLKAAAEVGRLDVAG